LGKGKAKVFVFPLPSRRLSSAKIVQGERNGEKKSQSFYFSIAEPPPIFCKGSARRAQWKRKSQRISFYIAEPNTIL